jgi:mono/diheme cytochrome c family protein
MSMKRCFELSATRSFSAVSRTVLVGGVLSLAVACARKDAARSDSAVAASDSTTKTASAMTAPATTPVESVSTGETTVSADSQKSSSAAGSNGAANSSTKSSTSTKVAATPTHHTTHHSDSSTTRHIASSPARSTSSASSSTGSTTSSATSPTPVASTSTASADTGQKTAADTSKKTASASGGTDHLLVSPQEYEGWKMFSVYCYRCHGVDAMGGGIAPNLRHSVSSEGSVTHEVFVQTVTNGRLDKGMPTWKALLSPEQIEDLWLYINARSSGRLYPGRPHMAQGANP